MLSPQITNHLRIEMLQRSALIPNPRNARMHSDKQLHQIAASIERFGFVVPVIVDDANLIVAGHGRWHAADILKLVDIPCIRTRFLSDADRRAFALADNRIAELTGWDQSLLATELNYLLDQNYDLDVTGFSLADLDMSFDGHTATAHEEPVELPDPDTQAVSRAGDLWHIGPHRLYCGNSLDVASYEALLGDARAAMVFADPPYNVPVGGHV